MKIALYICLSVGLLLSACKKEPLPDPCNETGYTLTENGCECLPPAHSAYGTCRETQKMEWYGVSADCPCVDTLFLKLVENTNDGYANFQLNDQINLTAMSFSQRKRIKSMIPWRYLEFQEGDSLGGDSFGYSRPNCITGKGLLDDDVEIMNLYGRFSPDMDTLYGVFKYHEEFHPRRVVDSCQVLFVK